MSLVAPDVPGYELASHYEAAREVGGDFFDLFRMRRRGRPLSVVIADVSGKGIAAALLMAFSRPLLHAAVDNTAGPAEALERTNRILVQERRSSLFITALCATLALPTGRLRIANAGHEPPLIIPGDGSPILPVDVEGPLLGAFGSLGLFEAEVELGGGDVVLFYTDGVTDARSASGERFEEDRLLGGDRGGARRPGDRTRSRRRDRRVDPGGGHRVPGWHAAGRRHHDRGDRTAPAGQGAGPRTAWRTAGRGRPGVIPEHVVGRPRGGERDGSVRQHLRLETAADRGFGLVTWTVRHGSRP